MFSFSPCVPMKMDDSLAIRDRERSGLLSRIVNDLKNDQRVRAAWLSGSVSRGEHDVLSDLDLSVVVTDESVNDFVDNRRGVRGSTCASGSCYG